MFLDDKTWGDSPSFEGCVTPPPSPPGRPPLTCPAHLQREWGGAGASTWQLSREDTVKQPGRSSPVPLPAAGGQSAPFVPAHCRDLHLGDLWVHNTQAAASQPHHGVGLVQSIQPERGEGRGWGRGGGRRGQQCGFVFFNTGVSPSGVGRPACSMGLLVCSPTTNQSTNHPGGGNRREGPRAMGE